MVRDLVAGHGSIRGGHPGRWDRPHYRRSYAPGRSDRPGGSHCSFRAGTAEGGCRGIDVRRTPGRGPEHCRWSLGVTRALAVVRAARRAFPGFSARSRRCLHRPGLRPQHPARFCRPRRYDVADTGGALPHRYPRSPGGGPGGGYGARCYPLAGRAESGPPDRPFRHRRRGHAGARSGHGRGDRGSPGHRQPSGPAPFANRAGGDARVGDRQPVCGGAARSWDQLDHRPCRSAPGTDRGRQYRGSNAEASGEVVGLDSILTGRCPGWGGAACGGAGASVPEDHAERPRGCRCAGGRGVSSPAPVVWWDSGKLFASWRWWLPSSR